MSNAVQTQGSSPLRFAPEAKGWWRCIALRLHCCQAVASPGVRPLTMSSSVAPEYIERQICRSRAPAAHLPKCLAQPWEPPLGHSKNPEGHQVKCSHRVQLFWR